MIVYSGAHTEVEAKRVRAYLAIKYGLTLQSPYDYVLSDGTTAGTGDAKMWSGTLNTGFNNNIFGLARKGTYLNQKVSQSSNTGGMAGILTVATSNDFTSLNTDASRTVQLADGDHILLGGNGNASADLIALPANVPSFDPAKVYKLISQKWLVQSKTGGSYNLFSQIDLSRHLLTFGNDEVFMVVADDAAFTTNVQRIPATSVTTNRSAVFQHTFTGNKYITFMVRDIPSMVPTRNAVAWYKGENATSGAWPDAISPTVNNTANDGNNVTIKPVNFNNSPYFDKPGNQSQKYRNSNLNNTWPARETAQTYYLIARNDVTDTNGDFAITRETNTGGLTIGRRTNNQILVVGNGYDNQVGPTNFWDLKKLKVVTAGDDGVNSRFWYLNTPVKNSDTNNRFSDNGKLIFIGGDEGNGADDWKGEISEVIVYNTTHDLLTTKKIQTYLALKYGGTLENGVEYVDQDGNKIWDNTKNPAYNNTIAGLANLSPLNQRVAQSSDNTTIAKMFTLATNNDFTSLNNTTTRTSLPENDYILFGSNGNENTALIEPTGCVPPSSISGYKKQMIRRIWLVQPKDGKEFSLFGEVDFAPYSITAEAFMIVADNEALTQNVSVVPLSAIRNGKATFQYTFTKDVYVSFGGTAVPGICEACNFQGVSTINFANPPGAAAKRFIPGQDWTWTVNANSGMTATFNFSGTDNVSYHKNTPREYWRTGIVIQKQQETVSTKITLNQSAITSFYIKDLDEWQGRRDQVVITGKCGDVTVLPKLTYVRNPANYVISGNTALANSVGPQGYDDLKGKMFVEFPTAVSEITITYTTLGGGGDQSQDIGLDDFRFSCPPPPPPIPADGISITKDVSRSQVQTCETVEYAFRLTNTRCDAQTVSLSDALPTGMYWVQESLNELPAGADVTFADSKSLNITSYTIPGVTTAVIKIKARFNAPGTFNNRATLTMANNNTYQSVDTYTLAEYTTVKAEGPADPQKPLKTTGFSLNGCVAKGAETEVTLNFENPNSSITYAGIIVNMILGAGYTYVPNSAALNTTTITDGGGTAPNFNVISAPDGSLVIQNLNIQPGTNKLIFKVMAPNNFPDAPIQTTVIQSMNIDKATPITTCDAIDTMEGASSLTAWTCRNYTLTGKVFNDTDYISATENLNGISNANGDGTNADNALNVVVVDAAGKVLTLVEVNADGTFTLPGISGASSKLILTSNDLAIGSTLSAGFTAILPAGYTHTGASYKEPYDKVSPGLIDPNPNGIVNLTLSENPTTENPNTLSVKFGVNLAGISVPNPPGGYTDYVCVSWRGSENVALLASSSDPAFTIKGTNISIESVTGQDLYYGGINLSNAGLPTTLTDFDPSLLHIKYNFPYTANPDAITPKIVTVEYIVNKGTSNPSGTGKITYKLYPRPEMANVEFTVQSGDLFTYEVNPARDKYITNHLQLIWSSASLPAGTEGVTGGEQGGISTLGQLAATGDISYTLFNSSDQMQTVLFYVTAKHVDPAAIGNTTKTCGEVFTIKVNILPVVAVDDYVTLLQGNTSTEDNVIGKRQEISFCYPN